MSRIQVTRKSGVQQDTSLINQLLFRYLPYWPLFVIMLVLGLVVAYVYIRYKVPLYEASASIMIKDQRKGADDSKGLESFNLFGAKKIVENEIEMLKSRTILRNVVNELRLYASVYEEGKVNIIPAFSKSPVELEIRDLDSIVPVKKLYFSYDPIKKVVNVEGKEYPLNEWSASPYGTIRFVPNKNYKRDTDDKPLFLVIERVKNVIDYLASNLTLTTSNKQSSVVNLRLKDPVPARGKLILQELIHQYDLAAIADKNQLAVKTLNSLKEKITETQRQIDSIEKAAEAFRTQNNLVNISAQGEQYLSTVGVSDAQVARIDAQLSVLNEVENYVNSRAGNGGGLPSTVGLEDGTLTTLIAKLGEAEARYEKLKMTAGENNPLTLQAKEDINRLRPLISENITSQRRNLRASRGNLSSNTGKYSSMLRSMPEKERQLLEITREQSNKKLYFEQLLKQKDETELSLNATVSDSRIVDDPEATSKPVSPNKMFVYLVAIFGGLAIAIVFITIKEGLNRTVLFRSEIENLTNTPVIGEVIHDDSGEQIVIAHDRKNFIAEQFRQIRTSLTYLGIGPRKKKVMVTSSIPGEGKSFVSANLAISLALTDKKVVLIELDLRKPKLSEIFGMNSTTVGISNFLIGEKEADEIIKRTDVNSNLFIISAGPIPPNPSELILNGRIQELLAYLENAFDYIVIDTAPVSPVTDAYLLSQFCDATLFVVRHGYTPRIYLQLLNENTKVRSLKNLALIFNGVKSRGIGKGGYGNGYGYGYGVGYDDDMVSAKKSKSIFGKVYR